MRLSLASVSLALAAVVAQLACSDATTPTDTSARLHSDSLSIALTTPTGVPQAIQLFLRNTGSTTVHVRMCNNGGYPAADLRFQELQAGAWRPIAAQSCADPLDGYDLPIGTDEEALIGRIRPAPYAGVFRYQVTYSAASGILGAVVSNAVEVRSVE